MVRKYPRDRLFLDNFETSFFDTCKEYCASGANEIKPLPQTAALRLVSGTCLCKLPSRVHPQGAHGLFPEIGALAWCIISNMIGFQKRLLNIDLSFCRPGWVTRSAPPRCFYTKKGKLVMVKVRLRAEKKIKRGRFQHNCSRTSRRFYGRVMMLIITKKQPLPELGYNFVPALLLVVLLVHCMLTSFLFFCCCSNPYG